MDKDKLGLIDVMPRYTPTEEIDVFATGGSVGEQYLKMMQGNAPAPATMQDYQSEADRLSFLLPQTRRPSIYDMASDLSQGLAQQAASGRPASVGYGLAAGFNLFSEGSKLRRQKREQQKEQLMQLAYQGVEKKRAEAKALAEQAGTYDFEVALENAKNGKQGLFDGLSSPEGRALGFLARYRANPSLKTTNPAEYDTAVAVLAAKFKTIVVDGNTIQVPIYDVQKLFGETPSTTAVLSGPRNMPVTIKTQADYNEWVKSLPRGAQYEDGERILRTKP